MPYMKAMVKKRGCGKIGHHVRCVPNICPVLVNKGKVVVAIAVVLVVALHSKLFQAENCTILGSECMGARQLFS